MYALISKFIKFLENFTDFPPTNIATSIALKDLPFFLTKCIYHSGKVDKPPLPNFPFLFLIYPLFLEILFEGYSSPDPSPLARAALETYLTIKMYTVYFTT